jgi:L-alanine-DL-glutamate epimerase-like enolase superfamily enzyme
MNNPKLVRLEGGYLKGRRPREAGCNARLPVHGQAVREPYAQLHLDDGSSAAAYSALNQDAAQSLLGKSLDELISVEQGVSPLARRIELPLWDLLGKRAGKAVYQLLAERSGGLTAQPLRVPCYDTTLYFDDLHLADDAAGARLIAAEARAGYEHGHRAFKIKVGRGALHMPLEEGTRRDIAVIRAVREAVGPGLPLMIDANNGYNVNLVKRVLSETADCDIYWLEEAFHEDRVLYRHLRDWMEAQGLQVLIADGEGQADPDLVDWARAGVIDVIQYDIRGFGFSNWVQAGLQFDHWQIKSAPHNYGCAFGAYAACHLAGYIQGFTMAEWDQIDLEGLDASSYVLQEGIVQVPAAPGFGLDIDQKLFQASVQAEGFIVS